MEAISKENKYAKISTDNDNLVCLSKSWYVNLSYYYTMRSPGGIQIVVPTTGMKKLKVQSTKPILIVFILLAVLSLVAGILYWTNPIGDESIESNNSGLTVGIIIAAIFLTIAFLFNRSSFGNLKILSTSVKGNWLVLYSSTDEQEIRSLKQTIENNILYPGKTPPKLVAVPPQ